MTSRRNKCNKVVMLLGLDFMHPYLDPRVYKEAKSLVGHGYKVWVVCWNKQKPDSPIFEEYEGIKVRRIVQKIPYHTTSIWLRFPFYLLYVMKSVRQSLRLKPDIIHCHDLDTLMIGVILKLLTRRPLIFDAHEDFPGMLEYLSQKMGRLARFYEKVLIKLANRVIAAEMPYVGVMTRHYNVKPTVIMNFPRLDYFHPGVDASAVITRHGLQGKFIISHIGGVSRVRGIYETLEALSYIEDDNIRYLIIGRSTAEVWRQIREVVRELKLEDKVIILEGGVDHKETAQYYKASDVSMALLYPIPNYVTSLPTKMFESLAVGTPVLAGNLEYLSSVVNKYNVGLCADSKDPKDIAEKIKILMADKCLRLKMGQNGLRAIREELNWGVSEKTLLELYDNILENRKGVGLRGDVADSI